MNRPPPISYLSDQPAAWAKALREASTLLELKRLCGLWREWVPDALQRVATMSDAQFRAFHEGLIARTSSLHWAEQYGVIAVPERLLKVSVVAIRYKAPFGTAAIRLAEVRGSEPEWQWLSPLVDGARAV
jgi:hypothetical protein